VPCPAAVRVPSCEPFGALAASPTAAIPSRVGRGERLAVGAVVVVQVASVITAEDVDAGEPAVQDGFDPAAPQAEDGLLESAAEVPAAGTLAAGTRAVRAALAEDAGGLFEGHASAWSLTVSTAPARWRS
jgi:hypothetical protein